MDMIDNKGKESNEWTAYGLLMFTMIIWGSTWPLGRYITSAQYGKVIPNIIIAVLRYYIVVPLFLVILKIRERSFRFSFVKKHYKELLVMGIFSVTFYQIGYLYGESFTSSSDAALIVSTSPIWALLITIFFFKYRINKEKILGTIIAFIGVLIIVGFSPNVDVENRLLGNALILFAAISYATYTVLLKQLMIKYDNDDPNKPSSLAMITWISAFGTITTIPVAFMFSSDYMLNFNLYFSIPERIWFGILYLAFFSTILAYLAYVEGVNRLDANRSIIFVNFIPLIGILLSGIFLHEKIDIIVHTLSLILIATGVTLVNLKKTPRNSKIVMASEPEKSKLLN